MFVDMGGLYNFLDSQNRLLRLVGSTLVSLVSFLFRGKMKDRREKEVDKARLLPTNLPEKTDRLAFQPE